jgi:SAM-dependent methyltransferase
MHEDRQRAGSFGDDAEQYDRARPSYPAALVDDLLSDGARRVLDVGCGTGIASRLFAERGCDVVGVEPDARMAAVATRHGIPVEISTFEEWSPPPEPFDLVVSAQAWHWVDPATGPAKAASALCAGGRFGAFWNRYGLTAEAHRALDEAYAQHAPELRVPSVPLGTMRAEPRRTRGDDLEDLSPAAGFTAAEERRYEWDDTYSRDAWLDQLPTQSDHRLLPRAQLDHLLAAVGDVIDELGGAINVHHTTHLITARRR